MTLYAPDACLHFDPSVDIAMNPQSSLQIADYVLVDVRVLGSDHYVVLAHPYACLHKDRYEACLIEYRDGQWHALGKWPWQGVGLVVPRLEPLGVGVLGRDGQIGTWDAGKASQSHLKAGDHLGPMRGLEVFDGEVYAYGMQRDVFTVGPGGKWVPFNEGMVKPRTGGKIDFSAIIKEIGRASCRERG